MISPLDPNMDTIMTKNMLLLVQSKGKCALCLLFLLLSLFETSARDAGAPNIDFSEGNFNGWKMQTGQYSRDADGFTKYDWITIENKTSPRFDLITSALPSVDPIVSCDNFYQNPFSDGAVTMRIGNYGYGEKAGAEGNKTKFAAAEKASYTFTVTEESKVLFVNFACVLHDPTGKKLANARPGQQVTLDHVGDQIPFFGMTVDMKSPSGVLSNDACSKFESTANKTASYLETPTGCAYSTAASSLGEYLYLPWTSTVYDLQDKLGYEITVSFFTHDCLREGQGGEGAGGHEAYGYFYVETSDLQLDVNNCESSGTNPTIKAPKGFAHYDWQVDGKDHDPIFIVTGNDSSEVEIDRRLMVSGSTYTCTMRGDLSSCSPIVLETKLLPVLVKPDMVADVDCGGQVSFTNTSTLNTNEDVLNKYSWDFADGHNTVVENPTHKYAKPGNYKVKLTAMTKHGCAGVDSFDVVIPDYPVVIIDGADKVCIGDTAELLATSISEKYSVEWMDHQRQKIGEKESLKLVIDSSQWVFIHVVDTTTSKMCAFDDSLYITRVLKPQLRLRQSRTLVCAGDTVSLSASCPTERDENNLNYEWTNIDKKKNVVVAPVETSYYKCSVTVKTDGLFCVSQDSLMIKVKPAPTVSIDAPKELCRGEQATLYGRGANEYFWHTGNSFPYQGDQLNIILQSDTTIKVVGSEDGCVDSSNVKIRVKQGPLVEVADKEDKVCPNQAASVTMLSAPGYVFEWQDGSTNSSLRKKITGDELWKVKISANGCTDSAFVPVFVHELPLVAIVSKDEVCAFDTLQLTVAGTPDRVEWIYPPAGNDLVTTDIPDGAVEYQVVGYSAEGCPNIVSKTVNVNVPVQVRIQAPDSVCAGSKAELTVDGNVESQRWYAGDVYFDYQKETSVLVREPVMIKVEATDQKGCVSRDSFLVDTISRPKVEIVGTFEVCPGGAAQVDAIGAQEYEWHDGVKTAHRAFKVDEENMKISVTGTRMGCKSQASVLLSYLPIPELWVDGDSVVCPGVFTSVKAHGAESYSWGYGLNTDLLEVSPSVPTKYTLTGVGTNGCEAKKVVTVTLRELPDVQITGDVNVCKDSVATITASGAVDYAWKHGKQGEKLVEKISGETTFEVIGVDKFGCQNTASFTVLPVDPPILSFLGNVSECQGEYVHLRAQGATTFEWYYGDQVVYTPVLDFIPDKDMFVKLVGTRLNCSSDMNIFVHPLSPPNVLITGDKIVCPGDEATITASGAKSYKWNTNEVSPTITHRPMLTTTFYVTGTDENGCTNTVPYEMNVYKEPKLDIRLSAAEGCAGEGDRIKLTALGGIFYEWSAEPEPEGLSAHYNSESMEISIMEDTKFYLKGRDENGCTSTAYKSIGMANRRTFDFSVTPGWIDESNPTVQFVGLSPIEAEWTWRPYSTAEEMPGRAMNYRYNTSMVGDSVSVHVRAVDAAGCVYEGSTALYVWKDIWAPEAFTPNGDEKNDGFRFYGGRYVEDFSFIIYNRLGEIMFEGRSLDDVWDGKWNGKECPWGVYGWVYQYRCKFGELERNGENRGFVTLVR